MTDDNAQAYPLQWPLGRKRTEWHQRARARFEKQRTRQAHTVGEGVQEILRELRLMDARDVVISSNIQLRADGLPRSGQPQPADPGVAVYFKFDGQPVALCCDCWDKVEHNLWAVVLTVEAMRGIDRWGAAKLSATFTGYAALPAPSSPTWWKDLEVDEHATAAEIKAAYRAKMKELHPDTAISPVAGDLEEFHRVQQAYEQAERLGLVEPMIRNAHVGERVHVLFPWSQERRMNGVLVSRWPVGCATGTITRKEIYWNQSPSLWVTPDDPAGVGETRFRPSELERLPKAVPA